MKRRVLSSFGLGFATATVLGNLIFNPGRPAWESVVSFMFILYFLIPLLRDG